MNAAAKGKIFDVVLTEALEESLERDFLMIDSIDADGERELPQSFEKKLKKVISSAGRKERAKGIRRAAVKAAVSAAAAFGAVFGVLLIHPDVSASVWDAVRSVFETHDKLEYDGLAENVSVDNFDDTVRLGYVPEGYRLSEGYYSPISVMLIYIKENSEDEKLYFDYCIADGLSMNIDNEHHIYHAFTRDGIKYHYYESTASDFSDMLIWNADGYVFSINAHLSKYELMKIAENLKM